MITTASLLRQYASALRGSWGDIDGRSEQVGLNSLADAIDAAGNEAISEKDARNLREDLGVCEHGWGHWSYACDSDCGTKS